MATEVLLVFAGISNSSSVDVNESIFSGVRIGGLAGRPTVSTATLCKM